MNIDENKVEKGIKYAKIIGIIIIIGLIIFFGYRSIASKTNTSNFYDYLDKKYTKQNDGSYEKKQETDSKQIIYRVLSDDYLFNKEINIYVELIIHKCIKRISISINLLKKIIKTLRNEILLDENKKNKFIKLGPNFY